MKPVILALIGMSIYATTGVVIERWLGKASTAALVLLFTAPMVPVAAAWLLAERQLGHKVAFPAGGLFWLTVVLGIVYFFGDYFYLGAFTAGGSAVTISTIAIMAPVLTAVARHFLVGGWPNGYQTAGYVLAAVAVLLIAKGAPAV